MNFPGAVLLNGGEAPKPTFYSLPIAGIANGCTVVNTGTSAFVNTGSTFTSVSAAGAAPTAFTYTFPVNASAAVTSATSQGVYGGIMSPAGDPWYWTPDTPKELVKSVWRGKPKTRTHVLEPKTSDTTKAAQEPVTADDANAEATSAEPPLSVANKPQGRVRRVRARRAAVTTQRLTDLAVLIAGERGDVLSDEWRSHLSGESGAGLPPRRQAREAAGFVLAAVRYRLQDVTDLAWRPVDTLLESRELSNLMVVLATLTIVVFFLHRGGVNGLADHLEQVAVVPTFALAMIHGGRRYRQVKPPERKPRRGKR